MKRFCYYIALLLYPNFLLAQMQQLTPGEIISGLEKLKVQGSVLYIAAHPDDENTRLLAYLAKETKVRTGYLSLTRGDGGQNLIGNEQAELLGLIRTQELLAARRTDGAEQFFTRANDFGFSKTSEESFAIWGKEQILADAVWVIRKFKPNVIITRFPEDARAGHGHHAGSAIIAREAFFAAADPKRFPEQLKFVKTWQAKRIVWNTFNFGSTNTTSPDQLKIDVGVYNPLLGKSYGEIAAISRTNHKSQGFGSALQRGESFEYFSHVAGEPAKNSLLDGINLELADPKATQVINEILASFNPSAPPLSIPQLIKLKSYLPNSKLLDELIVACTGLWVEVNTTESTFAIGDTVSLRVQAINRSNVPVSLSFNNLHQSLTANKLFSLDAKLVAAESTQPYWLRNPHSIGQYQIDSQQEVGFPENPAAMSLPLQVEIEGVNIPIQSRVVFKYTDPAKGEIYQPLVVAPPVTATMSEKAYIFDGNKPKVITVQLKSFRSNSSGYLTPQLPRGWRSSPEKANFNLLKKGDEQTLSFAITPGNETTSGTILLQVNANGEISDRSLKTISYDHIPTITLFPQAAARLEKIDLKIVGRRIGYIEGAGDLTAEALKQIGYEVTHLTSSQVINGDLSGFDAIVTGVRLYNVSDDIKTMQPKLLSYVEKGGTLVVQYNVNTNLKIPNLGPYPFKLSNKRVTEENAKVNFIKPADSTLSYPNKIYLSSNTTLSYPNQITSKDFEGWVQERGIYFATDIDPRYTTILNMNDTNEVSSNGSLLVANYGKGKYVYTSLVFFRELPAGVPGAYRLFVNLLAPKKP